MQKYTRSLIGTLAAATAPWFLLSPRVSQWLYRSKLFHPDEKRGSMDELKAYRDVEHHPVTFTTNAGEPICGWLFRHPASKKILLLSHGNAGDIATRLGYIKLLVKAGASVFIYDYRGFGASKGKPTLAGICEDGLAAYDYVVHELGYSPEDIILYGESLGTGVTGYIAERRDAAGIILQSGFTSLTAIGKEKVKALRSYPTFMFPHPRLNTLAVVKRPHAPLLIMHGEKDTTIPFAHSEKLFEAAREPKTFVRFPVSGHSDVMDTDPDRYLQAVRDFLVSLG